MRTQTRFHPGALKFRPAKERERFQAEFPNMLSEAEADEFEFPRAEFGPHSEFENWQSGLNRGYPSARHSDEFGFGSEYETNGMSNCPSFTPVAVEMPGGGRIKDKRIPDSPDIVVIQGAFAKTRLHRLAAEALNALVCAARADGLKPPLLLPTGSLSGFRSPQLQASLRRSSEAMHGSQDLGTWVAPPGSSAHQSGRAIDFYLGIANLRRNVTRLRQTSAYKWMIANAHRFGFYPYPKEPWHWEYNPPVSRQPEIFSEMDESFGYKRDFEDEYGSLELSDEFADETEYETGKKCPKDWCSPDYIQWVQKSFNQIAKPGKKLREDGFLDDYTHNAIRRFQKLHGLKPDGTVGPKTEQAIISTGATQPPEQKQLSCSPTKIETLISKLNKYRGNIPLHILLGWIEIESGRQIGSITNLCERGYFQFTPENAIDYRIKNHQLLSYDEDHSIQSGIKLVNHLIAKTNILVKKYGLPDQGDVYWQVLKLHHWIPSGPEKILADMQAHGVKPSSWAAITNHALDPGNRGRLTAKIKRDPQQGIHNANEMLSKANDWLRKLEANESLSKENESFEDEYELFEANRKSPSSSTRTPWKCENTSLGETLCANISLGMNSAPNKVDKNGNPTPDARFFKVEPMTGIFIPQAYVPKRDVDIVLYLHGHKTLSPGSGASIGDYWNGSKFPYFGLREEVNDSGQNVIFVAPTLGPLSQAGNLTTAKGFDNYLAQVLAALNEHLVRKNPPQDVAGIGKIILAAHSGGGSPMLRIAELKGSSNTSKIVECWGFDSVYGAVENRWADWAASHQNAKLFVYSYSTASRSKTLERISRQRNLQNVCVYGWTTKDFTDWARSHPVLKKSNVSPHFWVPVVYLKERLQNSSCRVTQTQSEIPVRYRRTPANSELEVSLWDNPTLQPFRQTLRNPHAQMLSTYAAQSIPLTVANVIAILKIICAYYGIPWRIAYTILEHEGGIRLFTHNDGVMQTTRGARNASIPLIPRPLKLALLGYPQTDTITSEQALITALHREFRQSLPVQIAIGIQELVANLEKFNGYVALAYQAYNAGEGWAYYTATHGAKKTKPAGITAAQWEDMCKFAASLLHQPARAVRISEGVWQCDSNIPAWSSHVAVFDAQSGLQLIEFKYLRSITVRIHERRPATPCSQAQHKKRESGSGAIVERATRAGSLDKLYQPYKLEGAYYQIAQAQLPPITDDGLPLKVELGQLVKMPLSSSGNPIAIP